MLFGATAQNIEGISDFVVGTLVSYQYWFLQTLAMMLTVLLIPKLKVSGPWGALIAVVGLAFVNSVVWDAALFFSIPDSFSSKALLLFFTNGAIFWLGVKLSPGIEVEGIVPALVAPVVFTVCSLVIGEYGKDVDWERAYSKTTGLIAEAKDYFLDTDKIVGVLSSDAVPDKNVDEVAVSKEELNKEDAGGV